MKFYCKKCNSQFDEDYKDLFENLKCPNCKHRDIVLNFIVQGVHPPETGLGISYFEFEDVLEEGKNHYLEQFFEDEFKLQYSRSGTEFSLIDKSGKGVNLEEIYHKTQNDGKLQRIIYNIYYVLLQDF
ncbi:MAG: hypothetical protein GOP50_06860 [Candidatus Heimdallarchaeota archaeon]|nr:hypothetical protein [Candidatus Heimdallarchaeota archaeon]